MIKNRTIIALVCVILALLLCFVAAPLVSNCFNGTVSVITLISDVSAGTKIEKSMLAAAQISAADALSGKYIQDADSIVGKYAKSHLYSGIITAAMLEESITDTGVKLRALKAGEFAMSFTVHSFAGGFSNKIRSGDIVSIATMNEENEKNEAQLVNELRYVEVIALTAEDGTDITEEAAAEAAETITLKLIDERQITALLNCEEGKLHIAFVTRDRETASEYLKAQKTYFEELDKETEGEVRTNG